MVIEHTEFHDEHNKNDPEAIVIQMQEKDQTLSRLLEFNELLKAQGPLTEITVVNDFISYDLNELYDIATLQLDTLNNKFLARCSSIGTRTEEIKTQGFTSLEQILKHERYRLSISDKLSNVVNEGQSKLVEKYRYLLALYLKHGVFNSSDLKKTFAELDNYSDIEFSSIYTPLTSILSGVAKDSNQQITPEPDTDGGFEKIDEGEHLSNEHSEHSILREISVTPTQECIIKYPADIHKTLQIVSGPGAGKTTTLCYRIAYMIENSGFKPSEILVLSMTNKAVDNMKQSLLNLLRDQKLVDEINILTFNSFCHKFVTEFDENYLNSDVIEDAGWRTVVQLMESKRKINKFKVQAIIRDLTKIDWRAGMEGVSNHVEKIANIHKVSKSDVNGLLKIIKSMKIITHSDILNRARKLLTENDFEMMHKVTIVDEFQDMYQDIFDIVKLVSKGTHLTVAGDPNQSIYGFLGSDPEKLVDQLNLINPVEKIEMVESFRSSPEILQTANTLIYDEEECLKKNNSDNFAIKEGPKPTFNIFDTSSEHLEFISSEINRLVEESEGAIQLGDIAILARTNKQVDGLANFLEIHKIQAHKLSSTPAWLSNDLYHFVDFLKIVNYPERSDFPILCTLNLLPKIGTVTIRKLYASAIEQQKSVFQLISESKNKTLLDYHARIEEYVHSLDYNDPDEIFKCATDLGHNLGLTSKISKNVETIGKNLILRQLFDFKENLNLVGHLKPEGTTVLEYFLDNYSSLLPTSLSGNSVSLSTIHSAKGLEFPIVFLPEFQPHGSRPMWDEFDSFVLNEEDKRRDYVGMTRARSLLYMQMNSIDIDPKKGINVFPKNLVSQDPPNLTTDFLKSFKGRNVEKFNGHNLPYQLFKGFYRSFHSVRRIGRF